VDTKLTPREREVLKLAGLGLSNQEIGDRLGMSLQTTKNHMCSINGKLATKKRQIAFAEAMSRKAL
jgi:DNA-binding CsgD family transcriptional regulator